MVPHLLTGSCNSCWFLGISYFWEMSSGPMSMRAAPRESFGGRWKTRQCHLLAPLTRCGGRLDRSVSSGPRSHFSLVWCSRQSVTPRAPRPDHSSPRRIYGADGRRALRDFRPHLCGNRTRRLARLPGIANAASSRLHLLSSPGRHPCLHILGPHHRQELSRHPHAQFLCRSHRLSDRGDRRLCLEYLHQHPQPRAHALTPSSHQALASTVPQRVGTTTRRDRSTTSRNRT